MVKKAIDFDLLRQELSGHLVDGPRERYRLDWPGKREALLAANAPVAKCLRPCRAESVDFDTTENLFIEGDNLDALKLLQETYLGKVKMIYIDPPYNTGKDFIYSDKFAESANDYLLDSGQTDEEGNRLVANTDANGRFHSDWLSMMYSRLKLARNLLRDDGVIFISIDDNEAHNLRKLCDEVFGELCLLGIFQWRRRQRADNRNQSRVSPDHEYIVACSKGSQIALKGTAINVDKYTNPDNDPRGPWASIDLSGLATATQRPNLHYSIVDPATGNEYPPNPSRGWSKSRDNVNAMIADGRILFPKSPSGRPREKKFLSELQSNVTGFSTCLDSNTVGFTTNGTRQVTDILGSKLFDFPKPTQLIREFIGQVLDKDDIILDFFAGFATTAHAVMQLNAEDGGRRKFIMVQLPEPCDEKSEAYKAGYKTIAEISKERIRRAGKKIKEELEPRTTRNTRKGEGSGDESDPASPGEADPSVCSVCSVVEKGLEVFFVDGNALAACFAKNGEVTESLCRELAKRAPLRVVFRDAGFKDDSAKINAEQIFKQLSPHTEVRTL